MTRRRMLPLVLVGGAAAALVWIAFRDGPQDAETLRDSRDASRGPALRTGSRTSARTGARGEAPSPRPSTHAVTPAALPPSDAEAALSRMLDGRPLRDWLADLREPDGVAVDPALVAAAREALLRGGAVGTDALFAALVADPRNGWNGPVRALIQDLRDALVPGLASLLSHADPLVRDAAFRELRKFGEAGGFGGSDSLVARAFLADGLDPHEVRLLARMPGAAAVVAAHLPEFLLKDEETARAVLDALRNYGPDGVAAVEGLLRAFDASLAESDVTEWNGWGGRAASPPQIAAALVSIGRGRPDVVRALSEAAARRPEAASDAWRLRALALAGDVGPLLDAFERGDDERRFELMFAVQELRPFPERIVAFLVESLADPARADAAAQIAASRAMEDPRLLRALFDAASRGGSAGAALWAVVLPSGWSGERSLFDRCLASPDAAVRLAVVSLPFAGSPAASWVERALRDAARNDADERVREAAHRTAASLGGAAAASGGGTDETTDRLLSWRDEDRASALADLDSGRSALAPIAERAVRWLGTDRPAWAPWNGVRLIEILGPRMRPWMAGIEAALEARATQQHLMLRIAGAVGSVGGQESVRVLQDLVRRRGELPELGAAVARLPSEDFERMLAATRHADFDVRAAFLRGLRSHAAGEKRDVVLGRARELLSDPKPGVRIAAAGTLIRLDPHSTDALAVLLAPLRGVLEEDDQTLLDACWELSEADVAHVRAAAPEIVRVLRGPVSSVAWTYAAAAAGRIPDRADLVVPALVAGVEGRYGLEADRGGPERVQAAAISALGALGPAAEAALPALRRAAESPNAWVAESARAAVQSIEGSGGLRASLAGSVR
ncbi:MAG: hypothetical protein HMLKMBBP_03157 [Planctomycetes bacterium]|nr:hypothetical protein [Planctomycetota bacterium]